MSKKNKRRKSPAPKQSTGWKPLWLAGIRAAVIAFVCLLAALALFAWMYLRNDYANTVLKVLSYSACAVAFFLCGIFSSIKNRFPIAKVSMLASFILLVLVLALLLFVSKGTFSLCVLFLPAFACLLPIGGGLVGRRI